MNDNLYASAIHREKGQRVSDALGRALATLLGGPVDAGSQAPECTASLPAGYAVKQANLKAALEQMNKIDPEVAKLYKYWFELKTDPKAIEPQTQRDPTWRNHQAIDGNLMNQMFNMLATRLQTTLERNPTREILIAYWNLAEQGRVDPGSAVAHVQTHANVLNDVKSALSNIAASSAQ